MNCLHGLCPSPCPCVKTKFTGVTPGCQGGEDSHGYMTTDVLASPRGVGVATGHGIGLFAFGCVNGTPE